MSVDPVSGITSAPGRMPASFIGPHPEFKIPQAGSDPADGATLNDASVAATSSGTGPVAFGSGSEASSTGSSDAFEHYANANPASLRLVASDAPNSQAFAWQPGQRYAFSPLSSEQQAPPRDIGQSAPTRRPPLGLWPAIASEVVGGFAQKGQAATEAARAKFNLPDTAEGREAASAYVFGRDSMLGMSMGSYGTGARPDEATLDRVGQDVMHYVQAHPGLHDAQVHGNKAAAKELGGVFFDARARALKGEPATATPTTPAPKPATETAPPATAQPSGGGAKQPPGSVGSVRPDGECDEDANVGPRSPTTRLPTKNGHWLGKPGNSGWQSTDPRVNAITGGKPVNFVNNRPDFTPWAKMSINFPVGVLTGNPAKDQGLARQALTAANNPDVKAAGSADKYMLRNDLTAHHAFDTCLQLVPKALNNVLPHIGAASDIRYQGTIGWTPQP